MLLFGHIGITLGIAWFVESKLKIRMHSPSHVFISEVIGLIIVIGLPEKKTSKA